MKRLRSGWVSMPSSHPRALGDPRQLRLRAVRRDDWPWIQHWFEDGWLNRELGPIDESWLEHVLGENDGIQLVAEQRGHPVGLVGVLWGTTDKPFHVITDLAVDPAQRRTGLGRRVLYDVMAWNDHPQTEKWVAYVATNNHLAAEFLASSGWIEDDHPTNMRRFEFTSE